MEKLGCAECRQLMKAVMIGGFDVFSLGSALNSVYYCENKVCKRVYLLAVGGIPMLDDVGVNHPVQR